MTNGRFRFAKSTLILWGDNMILLQVRVLLESLRSDTTDSRPTCIDQEEI